MWIRVPRESRWAHGAFFRLPCTDADTTQSSLGCIVIDAAHPPSREAEAAQEWESLGHRSFVVELFWLARRVRLQPAAWTAPPAPPRFPVLGVLFSPRGPPSGARRPPPAARRAACTGRCSPRRTRGPRMTITTRCVFEIEKGVFGSDRRGVPRMLQGRRVCVGEERVWSETGCVSEGVFG